MRSIQVVQNTHHSTPWLQPKVTLVPSPPHRSKSPWQLPHVGQLGRPQGVALAKPSCSHSPWAQRASCLQDHLPMPIFQKLCSAPQASIHGSLHGVWRLQWTDCPLQLQEQNLLTCTSFGMLPLWQEQLPWIVQHIDADMGLLCHVIQSPHGAHLGQWMLEAQFHPYQTPKGAGYHFHWGHVVFERHPVARTSSNSSLSYEPRFWRRACPPGPTFQVDQHYVDGDVRVEQIKGYWFIWHRLAADATGS